MRFFSHAPSESAAATRSSGRNPLSLVWLASAWLATLGNWPLWHTLRGLPEMGSARGQLFMLAFCGMVFALTALVLTLLAWRWSVKLAITLFLFAAAAGAYFMATYNIVIDSTMIANLLQTDLHEARDLFSLKLLLCLALMAALPSWWLWRQPLQRIGAWPQMRRNLLGLIGAVALFGGLLMTFFADMSGTLRNHHTVRYLVNPINSFYALTMAGVRAHAGPAVPPIAVGQDARLVPRPTGALPPLLLLVVGETARADHFALNGYGRATNPELAAWNVLSFRDVSSCGTSTAASVPCMFSVFGKQAFEAESSPHETLLDVLQRAGLAVLWLDNQAGCKSVCDRVPRSHTSDAAQGAAPLPAELCDAGGECLDEALLHGLNERLAALPTERRERGVVLVMHQMGSHGPAYSKRSPPGRKPFVPECETNVLQDCTQSSLINAYDNSIAYTDHVLAQAIRWLTTQSAHHATAMLYLSDHGESLGENNLYLHGLPYAFAPRQQKQVPMVMWFSDAEAERQKPGCLTSRLDEAFSHDNLSHTVLGLMGVQTSVYKPDLDVVAPCRLGDAS